MSERKSWDIQPRKKAEQQPAPQAPAASLPRRVTRPAAPAASPRPTARPRVQAPASAPVRVTTPPVPAAMRRERAPASRTREPLKDRRKRARRIVRTTLIAAVVLIIIAGFLALWLPALRVQKVNAVGPDQAGVQSVAQSLMTGTYYFVLPKDSIFLFPGPAIRAGILAQYPDISAVSISRTSFDSITLTAIARENAFLWCGATYGADTAPLPTPATSTDATAVEVISTCYDADSQGLVFASDAMAAPDAFRVYGPLSSSDGSVLGTRIANAGAIPSALEFVKAIRALGVSVTALALRGDEADIYTQGGTKITYVLGREQMALQLAQSAFPNLNLNDGSLDYVDLRFDGKVYFKKKGQETTTASSTPAQ